MKVTSEAKAVSAQDHWAGAVPTNLTDLSRRGGRLMWTGLAGFTLWATLFPLGSAVVAQGSLVSEGANKLVQHRVSGVVTDIYAKEGDKVRKGETIFRLDPVMDEAELGKLQARQSVLKAMQYRLQSEQKLDVTTTASLTELVLRGSDGESLSIAQEAPPQTGEGDELLDEQQRQFASGRAALQSEINGLIAQRNALVSRVEGGQSQSTATNGELNIIRKQVATLLPLVSQGNVAKKVLWDLQQQQFGLEARVSSLQAEANASRDEIDGLDAQIEKLRNSDARETSRQLTDVLGELQQIDEQLTAAESIVAATNIKAPATGILVHTKYQTIGGVIPAGETLAEIVPEDSNLMFRAHVSLTDITHVHVGQSARARLSSLNSRLVDDVAGIVTFIAADATLDPLTGQKYFEVEIKLTGVTDNMRSDYGLSSGMAGEAFIEGQSRTFASYVMKPFTDSLQRAFQEK